MTREKRVLVVEDDRNTRATMVEIIETLTGFPTDAAAGAAEALDLAQDHDYPIALLDIMMPEIDGITLGEQLRQKNGSIKLVFVTGAGKERWQDRVAAIDGAEIYTKPVNVDRVVEVIKEAMN